MLAFHFFYYSLGLFWTLAQVLLHTRVVHFAFNCTFSLLD
jgi:hypothetical protein